ncbi:MAG TPA: alpha-L-fucosidase [Abditibacteriaceae bacterium]|jgi:alpha-L-fucosidase
MSQIQPSTTSKSSWFTRDRFGLFIHWGLYALAARHEWVMQKEEIAPEKYRERYFPRFEADLFDANEWAQRAADAGMKYVVFTTKHHEGFCLWDTKLTDYKVTNSPLGRDVTREVVDAFRAHGLKIGLYHSLIDWSHPDFKIDDQHALRFHPDREALDEGRDQKRYAEYLHGQVRELLTDYGQIDLLFYDFSYPERFGWTNTKTGGPFLGYKDRTAWDAENLVKMCRELQPQILINDRLDLEDVENGWDYTTPEQFVPREGVTKNGQSVVWESCQTFSGSWGYFRDEESWKSPQQLISILIDGVSKGGNLLMNVGPTGRGDFDARANDALEVYARWMKRHQKAVYGCGPAPEGFVAPSGCVFTYNETTNRLYLHVLAWPFEQLHLENMAGHIEYAQLLHDASEVRFSETKVLANADAGEHAALSEKQKAGTVTLQLPVKMPDVVVPVIELWLKNR